MHGSVGGPIVRKVPVVEFGPVREDEGVVVLVWVLFYVLAGDPQKYFRFGIRKSLVDFNLCLCGVFAVKLKRFLVLTILFATLEFYFLRDVFLSFVV